MRDEVTVRFHTDMDKSFEAEVKEYCQDRAWIQTMTEGYDSNANSRVERRNSKFNQLLRTILLGATGGRLYYEELWDVGYDHITHPTGHLVLYEI